LPAARQASQSRLATASTGRIQASQTDSAHFSASAASAAASAASDDEELKNLDPKQWIVVLILKSLLKQKFKLMSFSAGAATASTAAAATSAASAGTATSGVAGNARAAAGAGEVHRRIELQSEMKQTSFQAQGTVQTSDGRSIQFSADLYMERQFRSASVTTEAVQATDPLVVNLRGAPVRLSGAKVAFDLNSDGKTENISFVASGSGFLAVDSNGDGQVNNGSELFGPKAGDGFAQLASYDKDGNGWIDENDPIFAKLRVWTQDGLFTRAENGIGAIASGSAETPFALKDSANVLQGNVRATGIYLSESGSAGTIQQVDLAVA
jgi:hypothetical protein